MIDDYRGLAIFVAVVEAGSFSGAGRRLKLSTSVVSHHISQLEGKLGVSLLFRSTRSLSLTPEGKNILDSAQRMVSAGEEALDALVENRDEMIGTLRITMTAFGDGDPTHQAVWNFANTHPRVSIVMYNSDAALNLVKEGFDLAIRLGTMKDSALKSRRIGSFHRALVASPDFLANRKAVKNLEELRSFPFIKVTSIPRTITLSKNGELAQFEPVDTRIEVNSINSAKAAVLAGLGVQILPLNEVQQELKRGELVNILPQWTPPALGIYALWPDSSTQKKLTRKLIDFMVASLDGNDVRATSA